MSSLTDKFGQKTNKQMKIKQNIRYVLAYHWGGVKCTLRTDCGLLFLGLENNGTIVVTFSFARGKQLVQFYTDPP